MFLTFDRDTGAHDDPTGNSTVAGNSHVALGRSASPNSFSSTGSEYIVAGAADSASTSTSGSFSTTTTTTAAATTTGVVRGAGTASKPQRQCPACKGMFERLYQHLERGPTCKSHPAGRDELARLADALRYPGNRRQKCSSDKVGTNQGAVDAAGAAGNSLTSTVRKSVGGGGGESLAGMRENVAGGGNGGAKRGGGNGGGVGAGGCGGKRGETTSRSPLRRFPCSICGETFKALPIHLAR